jgi:hypothetical protein
MRLLHITWSSSADGKHSPPTCRPSIHPSVDLPCLVKTDGCTFQHPLGAEARSFIASGTACDHGTVNDSTPQLPTDRVTAELRAAIEAGEWEPGQQPSAIVALAERFHTSRTTMQRAIARLAYEDC